jgi:lauroyl/myristoyl acyltransferase
VPAIDENEDMNRPWQPNGNGQQQSRATGNLPLWRRLRRRAYWLLLVTLLAVADRWPVAWGRRGCVLLARLALRLRKRERGRAEANLARAFPDWSRERREDLLRQSADALGANLFDSLAADRVLAAGSVAAGPGAVAFTETVTRLMEPGRGLFFLTGHLGCWELLGAWAAGRLQEAGLGRLGVVTGTLHNPAVDRLVQERRRKLGMKVLPREGGAAPLLAHLRRGQAVAVLLDQNTRTQNLPVPFFGHPAPTAAGLALLALRHGIPVLPVALARVGQVHQVRWLDPLLPAPAGAPVARQQIQDFLARCNRSLEELIRRNPAEWVWFHNRWEPDADEARDPDMEA